MSVGPAHSSGAPQTGHFEPLKATLQQHHDVTPQHTTSTAQPKVDRRCAGASKPAIRLTALCEPRCCRCVQELDAVSQQAEQPLDPVFVSDQTLLYRFLKGWKFDVTATVQRVNSSQHYRAEHGLTALRDKAASMEQRQFPHAEQILKYWPHVIMHGYDKQGQPLSIERLGHSNPVLLCQAVTLEQLMLYHHYHMECKGALLAKMSVDKDSVVRGCKIMDLQGLGKQHLTGKGIGYFKSVISASQDNYPETMGGLFIINAPWVFNIAWKMVRPLLHANTLDKIHILGSDYQKVLQHYIDPQHIPVEFGGQCTCNGRGCVPLYDPEADMTKVHVKAGGKYVHSLHIPAAHSAHSVQYEFRLHAHDISFGISFSSAGKTEQLVPPSRCGHNEMVSDAVTVAGEGELHVLFDNTYSRFTSKNVLFRVDVVELDEEAAEATKEAEEEERRTPKAAKAAPAAEHSITDGAADSTAP